MCGLVIVAAGMDGWSVRLSTAFHPKPRLFPPFSCPLIRFMRAMEIHYGRDFVSSDLFGRIFRTIFAEGLTLSTFPSLVLTKIKHPSRKFIHTHKQKSMDTDRSSIGKNIGKVNRNQPRKMF